MSFLFVLDYITDYMYYNYIHCGSNDLFTASPPAPPSPPSPPVPPSSPPMLTLEASFYGLLDLDSVGMLSGGEDMDQAPDAMVRRRLQQSAKSIDVELPRVGTSTLEVATTSYNGNMSSLYIIEVTRQAHEQ
eukprot:gene12377-14620_t